MDDYERHQRIWRVLYALAHRWICRKFHLTHEDLHIDGPVLLIPNHVNAWDPLLVAMSLKDKQVYYVASEHIFRWGFVARLLERMVAPIARRKASLGTDTVKACLRHLRAGHSICLFAEGEQCWDGLSQQIFPATGKLVKTSGATLVTYRIEGGYLSKPRWAKTLRRGRVHVGPVNVYPPELLKTMSAQEINEAINRDIYEDAWRRQREEPVRFRGRRLAEGLERALYLCPGCGKIGTLQTKGDRVFCSCGFETHYTETGFFEPAAPFETVADWETWQKEKLRARDFPHGTLLFSDPDIRLTRVAAEHSEELIGTGELLQYADRFRCGGREFMEDEIGNMALVQAHLLLLSYRGEYFELRSDGGANLRKYFELWKG